MVSIQRVVTPAVMRAQGGGWVVLQGWRGEGFLRRDTLQGEDGGHVRLLHITHYKKGKLAHHRACTYAHNSKSSLSLLLSPAERRSRSHLGGELQQVDDLGVILACRYLQGCYTIVCLFEISSLLHKHLHHIHMAIL